MLNFGFINSVQQGINPTDAVPETLAHTFDQGRFIILSADKLTPSWKTYLPHIFNAIDNSSCRISLLIERRAPWYRWQETGGLVRVEYRRMKRDQLSMYLRLCSMARSDLGDLSSPGHGWQGAKKRKSRVHVVVDDDSGTLLRVCCTCFGGIILPQRPGIKINSTAASGRTVSYSLSRKQIATGGSAQKSRSSLQR